MCKIYIPNPPNSLPQNVLDFQISRNLNAFEDSEEKVHRRKDNASAAIALEKKRKMSRSRVTRAVKKIKTSRCLCRNFARGRNPADFCYEARWRPAKLYDGVQIWLVLRSLRASYCCRVLLCLCRLRWRNSPFLSPETLAPDGSKTHSNLSRVNCITSGQI